MRTETDSKPVLEMRLLPIRCAQESLLHCPPLPSFLPSVEGVKVRHNQPWHETSFYLVFPREIKSDSWLHCIRELSVRHRWGSFRQSMCSAGHTGLQGTRKPSNGPGPQALLDPSSLLPLQRCDAAGSP